MRSCRKIDQILPPETMKPRIQATPARKRQALKIPFWPSWMKRSGRSEPIKSLARGQKAINGIAEQQRVSPSLHGSRAYRRALQRSRTGQCPTRPRFPVCRRPTRHLLEVALGEVPLWSRGQTSYLQSLSYTRLVDQASLANQS